MGVWTSYEPLFSMAIRRRMPAGRRNTHCCGLRISAANKLRRNIPCFVSNSARRSQASSGCCTGSRTHTRSSMRTSHRRSPSRVAAVTRAARAGASCSRSSSAGGCRRCTRTGDGGKVDEWGGERRVGDWPCLWYRSMPTGRSAAAKPLVPARSHAQSARSGSVRSTDATRTHGSASTRWRSACRSRSSNGAPGSTASAARSTSASVCDAPNATTDF